MHRTGGTGDRSATLVPAMETRPPQRTFRIRGRMSAAKANALAELTDRFRPVPHDGLLDFVSTFGRTAPVVLDLGFGLGASVLAHARAHPDHDVLGVEVHDPGISVLLQQLVTDGITNVRVERADGLELLARIPLGSLHAVHVFFPDPWPKLKHRARRLVRPDAVAALVDRLQIGGVLHVATDWDDYARQMRTVLAGEPRLAPAVEDRGERVVTKYERYGTEAGRTIVDLRASRTH